MSTYVHAFQRKPEDVAVSGVFIMGYVLRLLGIAPKKYNYPKDLIEICGRKIWIIFFKILKWKSFQFS